MKTLSLSTTLILSLYISACSLLRVVHSQEEEPMMEFLVDERPEGIAEGPGSTLYVSQILSGKVLAVDAVTGDTVEIVGEQEGREAWGLEYYMDDMDEEYLFVAGGGPSYGEGVPEVYVYNVATGETVVACAPLDVNETGHGAFINDLTIVHGMAYITNSFSQKLMVLDVADAIAGNCTVTDLFLPITFVPTGAEDWGANGIAAYSTGENNNVGLLVSNEIDGTVTYLGNLQEVLANISIPSFQEIISPGGALGADGLTVLDENLYVTQNSENMIGVFQLTLDKETGLLAATKIGNLTSPIFDTPATSAIYDGYIYSTNSRFVSLPDIATPADNNVVGVKNVFCCNEDVANGNTMDIGSDTTTDAPTMENGQDDTSSEPTGETGEATSGNCVSSNGMPRLVALATLTSFILALLI